MKTITRRPSRAGTDELPFIFHPSFTEADAEERYGISPTTSSASARSCSSRPR
jgi:hypothetical protein